MIFSTLRRLSHKKSYGWVGLFLIVVSFAYWWLPERHLTLLIFNTTFCMGNILFFDFLSYNFSGSSFLHSRAGARISSHLLLIGLVFGIMFEGTGHWLGRFFYFPYWNTEFYFWSFIPGWAFYVFYLIETYMGTKAVIEYIFHTKHTKKKPSFAGLKPLFATLGLVGALGVGATSVALLIGNKFGSTMEEVLAIINTPVISRPFSDWTLLLIVVGLAVFVWMMLEYIEYERRETSMLYEMIRGNFAPVAAVFISAWFSSLLYEVFNIPGGLWRYENIPFDHLMLLGVPLLVYVLWPIHYFPLFSLYRILFKKDSEEIWR